MTAIIAVFDPKTGAGSMAADSEMGGAYKCRSPPKVRRLDAYLIGGSGSLLADTFISHAKLPLLKGPESLQGFASVWRAWCKDRGHTEALGGVTRYPAHFLFLGSDGIHEIDDVGEAFKHVETTVAIGCGCVAALAAAHALQMYGVKPAPPLAVAMVAVATAIHLIDGCGGEIQVESLACSVAEAEHVRG